MALGNMTSAVENDGTHVTLYLVDGLSSVQFSSALHNTDRKSGDYAQTHETKQKLQLPNEQKQ